jgi:hypothetical protein
MFIGNHCFNNIVNCGIANSPHLNEEDVRAPCREHFFANLPGNPSYFPPTIRSFNKKLDRYGNGL